MKSYSYSASNTLRMGKDLIYKYKAVILFIFLFILYFSNNAYVMSGDTVPSILLPWAILDEHTIVLDDFTGFIITQWSDHYFVVLEQGHLVGITPIVTPIIAVPFYVPAYIMAMLSGSSPVDFSDAFIFTTGYCMKFAAVTIAALSVVVLFYLLKRLFDERWALILALCYGICTSTWTISSQSLWQHGTAELLIVCCYYLAIRNIDHCENINLAGIGALSALIFFNRPPDAILLLPILYYIVKERYWQTIPTAIIAGLPFLLYNLYFFSSVFGGYNSAVSTANFAITSGVSMSSPGGYGLSEYFGNIIWRSIDFNKILILYTPLSLLAIIGFINVVRQDKLKGISKDVHLVIIVSLFLFMVFFGSFNYSSGWGFGPRYWTDAIPLIILFVGWSKTEGTLYKAAFIGLALVSFLIQAYGAYVYLLKPY
jgi:hypothetical protein